MPVLYLIFKLKRRVSLNIVLSRIVKEGIAYYEIPFVIGVLKNVTTSLFPKTN
jgi:hypothetical protein